MQFIVRHPYCAAVKEAMALIGHPMGNVRPPLLPLPGAGAEQLRTLLHNTSPDLLVAGAVAHAGSPGSVS
jgi:dihydrodipicolinate synthase/N-acetylneuraminate lyase